MTDDNSMPLHQELSRLEAEASAAAERERDLREQLRQEWRLSRDLFENRWCRHGRSRIDDIPTPHLRQWTEGLIEVMESRGLAFAADPTTRALVVIDPQLRDDHAAAIRDRQAATRARKEFEQVNADGLADERRAIEGEELRIAVKEGDLEDVRKILDGTPEPEPQRQQPKPKPGRGVSAPARTTLRARRRMVRPA